jgi:predicted DCC family thiol-disulfide oxidoreductase YuxK
MNRPVLFFDGVCNLCNFIVRFLLRVDRKKILRYSNLQSEFARSIETLKPFISVPFETVVFYNGSNKYLKSDAVIEIAKLLPVPWKFFGIIRFIPKRLRDKLYDFVAHNRYRLFGRKDLCMLPSENVKEFFID